MVGHCRVVVMVLMRAQLGAEQVLVRKCAATPSSSHSQSEADRAPELVRMVVHAGANGLEIGDLGSVALLLLFSSLSTPLQRVLWMWMIMLLRFPAREALSSGIPSLVLVFMVRKRRTTRLRKAPITVSPTRMYMKLNAT